MLSTGTLFLVSLSLFVIFAWVFTVESKKGNRVLMSGARDRLDSIISTVTQYLAGKIIYLGRHTIKLSWYYGIHKVLRLILSVLVKAYDNLEELFLRNKDRAKTLKKEKKSMSQSTNHLSQMADHKVSSALTDGQKKKLLQKKLERG